MSALGVDGGAMVCFLLECPRKRFASFMVYKTMVIVILLGLSSFYKFVLDKSG